MSNPRVRAQLVRLLRGDFRLHDLSSLFIFARDHCDGREAVAEIGHFVAHQTERDKGITTRATRDWFTTARYYHWLFDPAIRGSANILRLPPNAPEYFRIALPRIGARAITQQTGIRGPQAHQILVSLADQLIQNDDQSWRVPAIHKDQEKLIIAISSVWVSKPAFEADRIVQEFTDTLKSNGLITKDEIRSSRDFLNSIVPLFAVSVMHNAIVEVSKDERTQLKARLDRSHSEIQVLASVNKLSGMKAGVTSASSMFSIKIDPEAHCHPDLLTSDWDFEIELSPDQRLCRLT